MIDGYIKLIANLRWPLILISLGWVAFAASGAKHLTFSNDYRIFFSAENPQLLAFESMQSTYTKNDNVLIVISPKAGDVFTPKTLALVEEVTQAAWQVPYSNRVDSISNYQHTYADADDLVVQNLYEDALTLDADSIRAVREVALQEPVLLNRLISPDGAVTGVNITIQLPGLDDEQEGPAVIAHVRQLTAQMAERYPDTQFHLTGMTMMNAAFPEAAQRDMATLIPWMFVIILLLVGLFLRVIGGTMATFAVIFMSIASALGIAGSIGMVLSPPVVSAPTMIMTIAVAHCVHLISNYLQSLRKGCDREQAVRESLRINMQPVFITSLTTAIGFLSMNFSDAPPFRDLGNLVATGVVTGYVLSVTFLPAMLLVMPAPKVRAESYTSRVMDRLADFVIAQRTRLLWIGGVCVVVLVSFIPSNELNDTFVEYFDESVQFRVDSDYATKHLTGIYSLEYSVQSGETNGINNPEYLHTLEEFADWFRQHEGVIHINTLSDTYRRLNKNLNFDDPAMYRLPESRDLAAQYLLLYEMSLPFGLDLNNQVNVDKSASRMIVTFENQSTQQMLATEEDARIWWRDHAPDKYSIEVASPTLMFSYIAERNITAMLGGTTIALVLISMILIVALRSVKLGFISLLPNLIPAALAFGLWGLFVGQVGLALSVVIGMTLGIVVDDTVHFLSKYMRARREQGMDSQQAVRYAFASVGVALWVTSIALVAGFLLLSQSSFELNSGMGLMTAMTISIALLADFLLLPPLLMKLDEIKRK